MNKKYLIVVFAMILIGNFGCLKRLDQFPQTSISDANFWKTPNDLALACNYLYSFLPGLSLSGSEPSGIPYPYQDAYSEIAFSVTSGANQISNGSRLAPATSNEWDGFYRLIRAANNILQKSTLVSGDQTLINKYRGEASFFRAWGYFELVKRFGDVPFITTTLTSGDTLLYSGRTDRETIINAVYEDLENAAAFCPMPDAQPVAEFGRITATAALALTSRIALFEGTWKKNHNKGDYTKHLQTAVDAATVIMNGGKHNVFYYTNNPDSSYYYLFQYQDANSRANYTYNTNKEIMLPRLYGQNQSNNISSHNYVRAGLTDAGISATKTLVDIYLFRDGLPVGKSSLDSTNNQTSTLTIFRNRDPRLGMTIYNRNQWFPSISGTFLYQPVLYYHIRKYATIQDFISGQSFVNFLFIRYAEVLLNYAEAKFELNNSISNSELDATINVIRDRSSNRNRNKLPLLTNEFTAANSLDMRTEIRRERTIELCFEGFHYWDILRWKTAEIVLPQPLLGPKYFPNEMPNVPSAQFTPEGFVILEPASRRAFNPERDYLWPLPTRELALNDNLSQNPKW